MFMCQWELSVENEKWKMEESRGSRRASGSWNEDTPIPLLSVTTV